MPWPLAASPNRAVDGPRGREVALEAGLSPAALLARSSDYGRFSQMVGDFETRLFKGSQDGTTEGSTGKAEYWGERGVSSTRTHGPIPNSGGGHVETLNVSRPILGAAV